MRLDLLPALLSAVLLGAAQAQAATATAERSFTDVRAADLRMAFHDVQIEVGQAGRSTLSVTTQAAGPGAAEFVKRAQPTTAYQDGQLTLRPPSGVNAGLGLRVRGRVVLRLPPGAALTVQTASSDVALGGAARRVPTRLTSPSGDLSVTAGTTELNLNTASGNLSVTGPARRLNATTLSGDVTVRAPVDDARLSSASGDLRLSGLTGALEARTVSGDVQADWAAVPRGPLKIGSLSGNISLSLPATAPGGRLSTLSGDLTSDFASTRDDDLAGASRQLVGAALKLDVNSVSGDISLRRR